MLDELYAVLRLYTNYFQPSMKLDVAKTPYHRVMTSRWIPRQTKRELRSTYATLNPAKLIRDIGKLQDELAGLVSCKIEAQRQVDLEYISS